MIDIIDLIVHHVLMIGIYCFALQHEGRVDPRHMEMGVKDMRAAANFGKPLGAYVERPDAYLKAHVKEPVLPDRESLAFFFLPIFFGC